MRVFNEEAKGRSAEVVIILTREEGKTLIEAVEHAVKSNGKKSTWKKLLTALETAAVY